MPGSKKDIKDTYPIPVYNFQVSLFNSGILGIPGLKLGQGDPISLGFTEVNGLNMEREHVVYKHGFSFLTGYDIIKAQPKTVTVTLKRGIVKDQDQLAKWYAPGFNLLDSLFGNQKKDIMIVLCDEEGVPLVSWKLRAAIPIKLEAPGFNASSNEVAIETLEVVGASLTVEYHK